MLPDIVTRVSTRRMNRHNGPHFQKGKPLASCAYPHLPLTAPPVHAGWRSFRLEICGRKCCSLQSHSLVQSPLKQKDSGNLQREGKVELTNTKGMKEGFQKQV